MRVLVYADKKVVNVAKGLFRKTVHGMDPLRSWCDQQIWDS